MRCEHNEIYDVRTMVYWACDECFKTYIFDPITHEIIRAKKYDETA